MAHSNKLALVKSGELKVECYDAPFSTLNSQLSTFNSPPYVFYFDVENEWNPTLNSPPDSYRDSTLHLGIYTQLIR